MKAKKTPLQRAIEALFWIVSGIQALLDLTALFDDLQHLVTLRVVLLISIGVLVTYLILSVLCRRRKIKWVSDSGQLLTIIKIGRKPLFVFLGGWIMLTFIAVKNFVQEQRTPAIPAAGVVKHPVFNADDRRFKILILPWEKECEYQGKKYNIGRVLQKTLSAIVLPDSGWLHTYYLADTLDYSNFTDRTADSLMRYHRANMILYGAYSLKECEGGTADKIYFNYLTDKIDPHLCQIDRNTRYNMVNFEGLDDIRKGNGHAEAAGIVQHVVAVAEIKLHKYAAAVKRVRDIKGFWQNKELLFLAGICYYYIKDFANAERAYKGMLKLDPGHEEALMHLGGTLASTGKWHTGKRYIEKVLVKDSTNIGALRNMAMISLGMQDTLTARMCVERIKRQRNAGTEHVLAAIGEIHLKLRDYTLAKNFIERSLALHNRHADRLNDLAMAYQHLKDTTTAIRLLKKAVGMDPQYADTWYHLGAIDAAQQRLAEAQEKFQRAVTADPYHAKALASLGKSYYFFSRQEEKGLEYMKKAVALAPKNIHVLVPAIVTYVDARLYKQVDKLLAPFLGGNSPGTGTLLNELGHLYSKQEDHRKALDCYKRSLDLLSPNAASYYNLATTYSQMRNKKEALGYLRKAVAYDAVVKSLVDKDESFSWLQGSMELCQILK